MEQKKCSRAQLVYLLDLTMCATGCSNCSALVLHANIIDSFPLNFYLLSLTIKVGNVQMQAGIHRFLPSFSIHLRIIRMRLPWHWLHVYPNSKYVLIRRSTAHTHVRERTHTRRMIYKETEEIK